MPDINNPNYFKDFDLDSLKVIAHGWVERYPVIKKILLFRGCRSRGTKDYKYKYILLVEHSIIRNPDDPLYPHYKEFLEDWINSNHSYFYQDLADAYSGDSLELNQLIFILPTNLPTINTALPPLDFIITGFPFILYDKEKEDAGDFDKERPGVLDEDKIKPLSPGKKELQESSGLKKDEYLNNPAIVQLAKEADSDTKIIYNAMIEDCRSKEVSFVNGEPSDLQQVAIDTLTNPEYNFIYMKKGYLTEDRNFFTVLRDTSHPRRYFREHMLQQIINKNTPIKNIKISQIRKLLKKI